MMQRLLPFLFLGIMIVIFAVGLVIISYLLIVGAVVGMVLFLVAWIREKLAPEKRVVKQEKDKKAGRVIDHE